MLAEKINKARAAGLSDDEIATFISEKDQTFAGKLTKSREAGLSNTEVLNFLAGPKERSSPVDPSYLAEQFQGGLGRGIQGYANTADKLGVGGEVSKKANELGQAIASGQRESATDRFFNPKQGDTTVLGYGVGSIPGAIAESGAGMVADLGAMVAGGAAAGPAGAIALPLASYGLREYGDQLDKRMANQGGAPASGTDQAAVAASVLAQAALNRVGLGKVGGGASIGNRGWAEGGKRIAGAIGTEAATEAAQQLTEQVGSTAGTQKGLTIDPRELGGAAILGGASGGTFRLVGEAGVQARNVTDAYNTRSLDFKEEAGNVASEIARISEANKRELGNAKQDTQSLIDYESRLNVMREAPTKRAVAELDAMKRRGEVSEADHAAAVSALTDRPTVAGLQVAERLIGGMGEGADAISLAKRASIVGQIKEAGGYTKDGVIKGGLGAKAERLLSEAKNTLVTAGLGGGLAYAGYKGLGTFGATLSSLKGAAPAAAVLGGTYLGLKALDKLMGTSSPTAQVVRRFGKAGNPVNLPSDTLPTYADLDEADRVAREGQRQEAIAQQQQARSTRAQEQMARNSVNLAKATQKLDLMRGVVRDAAEYEAMMQTQATAQEIKAQLQQVNAEIAKEQIRAKQAKAAQPRTEAQPQPQAQAPQAGSPQAQAAPQGTGVLSGPTQSTSPAPAPAPEIDAKTAKAIQNKARIFTSFRKRVQQFDTIPEGLIEDFQTLNGDINNYKEGRQFVNRMIKKYPDHAAFIRTFWLSDSDQPSLKQNLAKIFAYNDGDGNKIIMTRKQADQRTRPQ